MLSCVKWHYLALLHIIIFRSNEKTVQYNGEKSVEIREIGKIKIDSGKIRENRHIMNAGILHICYKMEETKKGSNACRCCRSPGDNSSHTEKGPGVNPGLHNLYKIFLFGTLAKHFKILLLSNKRITDSKRVSNCFRIFNIVGFS